MRLLCSCIRATLHSLLPYLAAGAVYITIGVFVPEFLFSWVTGAGFLFLALVALPWLVRRRR